MCGIFLDRGELEQLLDAERGYERRVEQEQDRDDDGHRGHHLGYDGHRDHDHDDDDANRRRGMGRASATQFLSIPWRRVARQQRRVGGFRRSRAVVRVLSAEGSQGVEDHGEVDCLLEQGTGDRG